MPSDSVVFGSVKKECDQILYDVGNKIFTNREYNEVSVATLIK